MNLNQNLFVPQPFFNALVPNEGPKGIPFTLDFSAATELDINYQNMQQRGFISEIQGVWIDTKDAGGTFEILVSVSGQRITIPVSRQGYVGLMVPNPPAFQFSCPSGQVRIILVNFPVNTAIYAVA